jgi:tetratricopeptide (TPR) repeat protein
MEKQDDQGDRGVGEQQQADSREQAHAGNQNGDSKLKKRGNEQAGGDGNGRKAGSDRDRNEQADRGRSRRVHEERRRGPSRGWTLLLAGAVGLVCGSGGAFAYSHFFASAKPGNERSSSRGSTSTKGSDSGKESESGESAKASGRSDPRIRGAQDAWMAAVKELHQVQAAEREARESEEDTRTVLDFLRRTILSAGRPGGTSLSDAFWAGGGGKDVSLRKAVDQADMQVSATFADRPAAEALVRELLGFAYLSLGDPARAVSEYERALALREATSGTEHSEIAACRNQLAIAYRLAGRITEAAGLFDQSSDSPEKASALALAGATLLLQNKPVQAELTLRKCLAMRQRLLPDDWTTFDTQSLLGEALLEQKKLADAEPLLLTGYEGLKARADSVPPPEQVCIRKAGERLVRLYQSWGKTDEAAKWRKQLESRVATKTSGVGKSGR